MAMGRPKAALLLEVELREQLEGFANSRSLPAGLVRRAKMILLSASGKTNREIAQQVGTSHAYREFVAAPFFAAAKLFASRGWEVIATMRNPNSKKELTCPNWCRRWPTCAV